MESQSPVRIGVRTRSLTEERLRLLAQLGVTDVFVDHAEVVEEGEAFVGDEGPDVLAVGPGSIPTVQELEAAKEHIESFGLTFAGVHSLPYALYGDVKFDLPGRDQSLEQITTLIRNLGAAGVPILGYQWMPRGLMPMRTEPVEARGGAEATAFDYDKLDDPDALPAELDRAYTREESWEYYEGFLETVLPVAEEVDVTLALHPDDPPIPEQGSIPRLFHSVESFDRAMNTVPSDNHGLKLCLGCFAEMGEDPAEVIEHFGDDIVFVHFRNVSGTVPTFNEAFVDDGDFAAPAAMRALHDVGFDGAVVPDHVPKVEDDEGWRPVGRAYTVGYLRGLWDDIVFDRD
jgi:mannonate dehydratase